MNTSKEKSRSKAKPKVPPKSTTGTSSHSNDYIFEFVLCKSIRHLFDFGVFSATNFLVPPSQDADDTLCFRKPAGRPRAQKAKTTSKNPDSSTLVTKAKKKKTDDDADVSTVNLDLTVSIEEINLSTLTTAAGFKR